MKTRHSPFSYYRFAEARFAMNSVVVERFDILRRSLVVFAAIVICERTNTLIEEQSVSLLCFDYRLSCNSSKAAIIAGSVLYSELSYFDINVIFINKR